MRRFRFKQMNLIEEESVSLQLDNLKKKKPTEKNQCVKSKTTIVV
jgi:hypothetical protein